MTQEAKMQMPAVKWDFNAYTIIAVIISTAANYAVTSYRVEAQEKKSVSIETRLDATTLVVNQLGIKDVDISGRLSNTIESVQDLRRVSNDQILAQSKTNGEVLAQLSAIRETLAWFRAMAEANGNKPPPLRP